jgi:DNA-binding NarL/FixJ family response regulator
MSEPDAMKVLLIDDHPLILTALQGVIQGIGTHVSVVGVAGARTAREALAVDPDFDLVLLDLRLGDADGFELLVELRNGWPAIPVVVVSASDHSADVIRAIDLGAMGFVPKRASNETLTEALQVVMSGGIYVPPMTMGVDGGSADRQRDGMAHIAAHGQAGGLGSMRPNALASVKLTPRQLDVLGLLLRGQSNKLIARELNLSVETVKDHVAAVLRALNVNSRTQAVLAVSQMSGQGAIAPWLSRPAN